MIAETSLLETRVTPREWKYFHGSTRLRPPVVSLLRAPTSTSEFSRTTRGVASRDLPTTTSARSPENRMENIQLRCSFVATRQKTGCLRSAREGAGEMYLLGQRVEIAMHRRAPPLWLLRQINLGWAWFRPRMLCLALESRLTSFVRAYKHSRKFSVRGYGLLDPPRLSDTRSRFFLADYRPRSQAKRDTTLGKSSWEIHATKVRKREREREQKWRFISISD